MPTDNSLIREAINLIKSFIYGEDESIVTLETAQEKLESFLKSQESGWEDRA